MALKPMEKKRILGIDYGDQRTGLAVSDPDCFLAGGLTTVCAAGDRKLIEQIDAYVSKYEVGKIVLGHPINMNGTRGPRAEKAERFAEKLRSRFEIEVILWDERRTTMAADVYLQATETFGKKRKKTVDTLSAQIILQEYLDFCRRS